MYGDQGTVLKWRGVEGLVIYFGLKFRGTSPIRKRLPLGPYGRPIPRAL